MAVTRICPNANSFQQYAAEVAAHKAGLARLCSSSNSQLISCQSNMLLGLFFDGTGNNRDRDQPKKLHSNVVRLFHLHPNNRVKRIVSVYLPEVGTPFPEIGEQGESMLGSALAKGGQARINYAINELFNAISSVLINKRLFEFLDLVKTAQGSASAALAGPGFKNNRISKIAGVAVEFYFAGLLDTVASVGLAGLTAPEIIEGHLAWGEDLRIPPNLVKVCRHYIALHEVSGCFPLDNIYHLAGNSQEIAYPGAHSDIGGGYGPNCQGKTDLSMRPGRHLYFEARTAGVPLLSFDAAKVDALPAQQMSKELTLSKQLESDFNCFRIEFIKLVKQQKASGSIQLARVAMSSYFAYRGAVLAHYESLPFYQKSNQTDRSHLKKVNDDIKREVARFDGRISAKNALINRKNGAIITIIKKKEGENPLLSAFYSRYVHDSMASFIGMKMDEYRHNGVGIVKYRRIYNR